MDFTLRKKYTKRSSDFTHSNTARPDSNTRHPKKGKVYAVFFSPNKDIVKRRKRAPPRDGGQDKAGEFVAVFPSKPKISQIPGIEPDTSIRFQSTHQCQVAALHYEDSEELNEEPQYIPLSSQCWGSFEEEIALEMNKYPYVYFIGPGYNKSDGTISDIQLVAGGNVEEDETPLDAIRGEVAEELGFTDVEFLKICTKMVNGSQHTLFLGRIKA